MTTATPPSLKDSNPPVTVPQTITLEQQLNAVVQIKKKALGYSKTASVVLMTIGFTLIIFGSIAFPALLLPCIGIGLTLPLIIMAISLGLVCLALAILNLAPPQISDTERLHIDELNNKYSECTRFVNNQSKKVQDTLKLLERNSNQIAQNNLIIEQAKVKLEAINQNNLLEINKIKADIDMIKSNMSKTNSTIKSLGDLVKQKQLRLSLLTSKYSVVENTTLESSIAQLNLMLNSLQNISQETVCVLDPSATTGTDKTALTDKINKLKQLTEQSSHDNDLMQKEAKTISKDMLGIKSQVIDKKGGLKPSLINEILQLNIQYINLLQLKNSLEVRLNELRNILEKENKN